MINYFDFFKTLHDERGPIGNLPDTHYSVFSSTTCYDYDLKPLSSGHVHNFSIIWDEDHDTRIIPVIHHLYMLNLLSPAIFLAEGEGCLTIKVNSKLPDSFITKYQKKVQEVQCITVESDYWPVEIDRIDLQENGIINKRDKYEIYLQNIISLWDLGVKPFKISHENINIENNCSEAEF